MNTKKMRIVLDDGAYIPLRAHETDAGLDLRTPKDVTVPAKGSVIVDTGVHIELPPNTVGMLKSKSGLNVKYGITSEGVIDVGYTGSIVAKLYNHSETHVILKKGNKITQLVIIPIVPVELEQVSELMAKERGSGGFGSTGR